MGATDHHSKLAVTGGDRDSYRRSSHNCPHRNYAALLVTSNSSAACLTLAYHSTWDMIRTSKLIGTTTRCMSSLCMAGFMPPSLSRQSMERLPLVRVEKAKLVALDTQCTVLGAGTFTLPTRVVYCSHKVKACKWW